MTTNAVHDAPPSPREFSSLHPVIRVTLLTIVCAAWAVAIGGNLHMAWSSRSPLTVHSRPAKHGPGLVAEITNTSDEPVTLRVRPGRIAHLGRDTVPAAQDLEGTLKPGEVWKVGWRDGFAWNEGDEVVVEYSGSCELRTIVR